MTNDYMAPEVIQIGEAQEVILGDKSMFDMDDDGRNTMPDAGLDD
jgi:hypothetical protein